MELENVEAAIPLQVSADGRVSGLTAFARRRVLVIVPDLDAKGRSKA